MDYEEIMNIDPRNEKAIKREAAQMRRARLDKPLRDVLAFARTQARREMVDALMRGNRSVV